MRLLQDRIEYRREIAGRGIDDLQHLGSRGLPPQRLVALGSALGKLPLQIGYKTICSDRLMCCQASRSFADLVGTDVPGADHTVIGTGHHRLSIGRVS